MLLVSLAVGAHRALEAADRLAVEGVSAEVIDLRSLRPLDDATIMESVTRTHRAIVVDEGWRSVGLSGPFWGLE